MTKKHTFTASIQNAGGGGAFVEIPFDVEKAFGSKRPKVKAMIEGIPYRGTLVRMGTDCHLLLILKEIRGQIGWIVEAKKDETRLNRVAKTIEMLKQGKRGG